MVRDGMNKTLRHIFTYRSPHFCFPWWRPCDYHAICCMDGKTIQCLPNPSQHVPIYLQQFPSYTVLKSMRKSKNRYFYHIFVSPGDTPGAITLNVVWLDREFDTYKLSRTMYPSIFNSFPVIRTANAKNCRFHVQQPTFLFPLETPLRVSHNVLHGWKDNSMPAKPLAACTYLSSIVSELYDAQVNAYVQKSLFLEHFCFPWGCPCGNHAKCCTDGKSIRCLQIV